MKIDNPNTRVPANTRGSTPPETSQKDSDRDRASEGKPRFGEALQKRASQRQANAEDMLERAGAPGLPPWLQQAPTVSPAELAQTGGVGAVMPPEIAALSDEIQHTLETHGVNEVRIQFDASVLDGLSVTLTRDGGMLQVALQAASPEMARFLEVHASSLAQTLERPGQQAFISVETRPSQGEHSGQQGGGGSQGQQKRDDNPGDSA